MKISILKISIPKTNINRKKHGLGG